MGFRGGGCLAFDSTILGLFLECLTDHSKHTVSTPRMMYSSGKDNMICLDIHTRGSLFVLQKMNWKLELEKLKLQFPNVIHIENSWI